MVLPTLHSYSAAKHLTTPQETIQTKQEIETEKKIAKTSTRPNSGYSKWTSPISGILSDEALRLEQEKQEKSKRLEQRRSHLSAVLEAEKNKFQNELTSIRQSSRESIPEMKIRTDSLRSARQVTPDEKLHEHWITTNPDLHSIDQQKFENLQPEYWSEQLNEKRLDQQDERQRRIEQLKLILQQQMNEIKEKEEESELLKQEEEHLLNEQCQLDQYEEERKQMEKRYVQQDYGRQLLRQHKTKLHKRAKEIQEQLELDMKILASLAHLNDETRFEQRKQFKRDALNMFKQFEQQMKLEKEKEQQFDAMFQEEAAKQWSHRDQEWNHEKESRENLMRQLLDQRQEQIMDKLQTLKEQQQEIYDKQRILINDMEQARKYDRIQRQKQDKEKEEKKQILIGQQERAQSQLELEKQDAIERGNNKQKPVITETTVEPKFYGRRRVNWN